jgi:hypothetical protein
MNFKKAFSFGSLLFLIFILGFKFSYAVTVGPAKIEFRLNPGETVNFSFFVRNDQNYDVYLYSDIEGFTEEGTTKVFLGKVPEVEWVEIEKKVFLKSGDSTNVPVKIKVPENAPPGGHFLVIWFGTAPAEVKESGIGIGVRVGSLIYLNVSGNVIEKISIQNFKAPRIAFSFPVKFIYSILNEGNTYVRPTGDIEIKNLFGKLVANLKVNPKEVQILPGKSKDFEDVWENTFAFGPYKVIYRIQYGENREFNFNYWFFMFPIKIFVLIIVILVFVIFILPRLIRKYNQWIIQKYSITKNNQESNQENNQKNNFQSNE